MTDLSELANVKDSEFSVIYRDRVPSRLPCYRSESVVLNGLDGFCNIAVRAPPDRETVRQQRLKKSSIDGAEEAGAKSRSTEVGEGRNYG